MDQQFLNKYKDKISVINKDGHIGVVMRSKQPINKDSLSKSRNLINGLKKNMNFGTQQKAISRNVKDLLSKLREQNKTKHEEISAHHKLQNSKVGDQLDPTTINTNITKATDRSSRMSLKLF